MLNPAETVVVGRITTVYGVRGWVKIHSYTEQPEMLFEYLPWQVESGDDWQLMTVTEWRRHGDGLVAHLTGVDDREVARNYCQKDIRVSKSVLPELTGDEYYWHQLQGLSVVTRTEQGEIRLGKVTSLMETGANDVLVVRGDADSVDREERLIPYVDQFVLNVDLPNAVIEVDWDPAF